MGPPLFGAFQPYPLLYIPQGVSRETGFAWHGLGLALIGMAWHGSGLGLGIDRPGAWAWHGLGHGLVSYPTDRSVN